MKYPVKARSLNRIFLSDVKLNLYSRSAKSHNLSNLKILAASADRNFCKKSILLLSHEDNRGKFALQTIQIWLITMGIVASHVLYTTLFCSQWH